MHAHLIIPTPSAYTYPLLVKHLLTHAQGVYSEQEITCRNAVRCGARTHRPARLGSEHTGSAARFYRGRHGRDSHRYLGCDFGVPMMGATLFAVNVRLSAQQILYTLNDARAEVVLVSPSWRRSRKRASVRSTGMPCARTRRTSRARSAAGRAYGNRRRCRQTMRRMPNRCARRRHTSA
jgi:acyl-CoA synthetase (AMP-forming)/AMP-acid ligase II